MPAWLQQFWNHAPALLADKSTWIVIFDIILVYYLLYRGLLLLKGTKAVRMLLGLLLLVVLYFFSRYFGLKTITWILDHFFDSFILVVLILFQDDIRRGLSRFGLDPFGSQAQLSEEELAGLNELKKAVGTLSTRKIGALVVIEREADIRDYIQEGTLLDARISEEILFSVFLPYSPLHDGAVILHQGRITRAGCFLPLTQDASISKHLGTRHRAAIGLTETTDALVVVVSETDGKISLCRDGLIQRGHDPSSLYNELISILRPSGPTVRKRDTGEKKKADDKKTEKKADKSTGDKKAQKDDKGTGDKKADKDKDTKETSAETGKDESASD